jgi:hypothetical protein
MRIGRPFQPIQYSPARLVDGWERQLHVRLDIPGRGSPVARYRDGRVAQRGLADTQVAARDQPPTASRPNVRGQPVQDPALLCEAPQRHPAPPFGGCPAIVERIPHLGKPGSLAFLSDAEQALAFWSRMDLAAVVSIWGSWM